MINNIPSDKELFDLENRIRVLLAELVTPVILKTKEHDSLIKKALSSNRKNKKTIQTLEIELKNSISKLAPLDELNKRISVLLSDQKTSAKAIGLEIGLLNAKLDETLYKYSDFDSKFRMSGFMKLILKRFLKSAAKLIRGTWKLKKLNKKLKNCTKKESCLEKLSS